LRAALLESFIHDSQRFIKDIKCLLDLVGLNEQWWVAEHRVATHHSEQAALQQLGLELEHRRCQGVCDLCNKISLEILGNVEATEQASDARLLDAGLSVAGSNSNNNSGEVRMPLGQRVLAWHVDRYRSSIPWMVVEQSLQSLLHVLLHCCSMVDQITRE
jgi:hypothetical protein